MTMIKKVAPVVALLVLAVVQWAILHDRIGSASATAVAVGEDLSEIQVRAADGTDHPLSRRAPLLVLVFDPHCTHSQRIAPRWSAWIQDMKGSAHVLALAAGSPGEARAHAGTSGWAIPIATIAESAIGSREHALVNRTPWVFALDSGGRVVAEGHGSRLREIAGALKESPAVRRAGWGVGTPGTLGR